MSNDFLVKDFAKKTQRLKVAQIKKEDIGKSEERIFA
jgi:hypothetical protein